MIMNNSNFFQGASQDGSVDFIVTFDSTINEYVADIFDANIKKTTEAYIDTFSFSTLTQAVDDLTNYQLDIR